MNEFQNFVNEYGKILNSIFDNKLKVGSLFAPKNPFEITEENYVSGAMYKGSDVYAGWVENILSDDEIILKVTGRYSKKMVPKFNNPDEYEMDGWNSFRGPATYVKYKLIPGESYYICDEECDGKPWETGEWTEVVFE
jgi:hypothetical protein